jgi:phospho-N-acetylmuramoyl-pentapeptide-transferase
MMYHLSLLLKNSFPGINVVHYISFRCMASLLSTLFFSLLFGSWFIDKSKKLFRSKTREYAPDHHKQKDDMPTMGGIFILAVVFLNCLLWADLSDPFVIILLLCLLGFGALGFWDDWKKITMNKGISARSKFMMQWSIAAFIGILLVFWADISTTVTIPFLKSVNPNLGIFFIVWAMFTIVSCSNAVNLTDGLDGLAIGSLIPNFMLFTIICYLAGHSVISSYLQIPFANSSEIAVVGATLIGASLGFLWYNTYPAQIFMGDVGSLSLGAVLALMALIAKQELLLAISGGLFILETVSVMIQVFIYKRWKKRIFKMAPIHHHFELLGWPESKITMRFAIISLILCLIALMTLKIR